jgi:hypothetical protein
MLFIPTVFCLLTYDRARLGFPPTGYSIHGAETATNQPANHRGNSPPSVTEGHRLCIDMRCEKGAESHAK